MAAKKKTPAKKSRSNRSARGAKDQENRRLWLMFPPRLIKQPVIWELAVRFELVTNVRQASVNDEIGLVSLELSGARDSIKKAIRWLERKGVSVEPVEINVIES